MKDFDYFLQQKQYKLYQMELFVDILDIPDTEKNQNIENLNLRQK